MYYTLILQFEVTKITLPPPPPAHLTSTSDNIKHKQIKIRRMFDVEICNQIVFVGHQLQSKYITLCLQSISLMI